MFSTPVISPVSSVSLPLSNNPTFATSSATTSVVERNQVRVVGEGKQTLLFCNGFGCNQHIWRYLTGPLATQYKLVLFDYAGLGESETSAYVPQKYSTMAGYAQDVVEICQELGLQQVVLVGHSVGATIAMLAAVQAPEYFSRVIMIAPSPCYLNKPDYYGGIAPEDMVQLLELMDADYDTWASLFAGLLSGPDRPASLGEELIGYFCNMDKQVAQQFARVAFLADNRAELARLQLPTLLLQCSQDAVAPEEVGQYMAAHLPKAKLVQLQATGHCPHLSAPLETLNAMKAFLTE